MNSFPADVSEPERIRGMLENANVIVAARAGNLQVGISRAITDHSFCTYEFTTADTRIVR